MIVQNTKQKKNDTLVKPVTLKPICGVLPIVYVPIVWAIILTCILLVLNIPAFFFSKGQYVRFTSTPHNAAIFIDDIYRGSTYESKNNNVLLKKGQHTVKISLPNFEDYTKKITTKNKKIFRRLSFQKLTIEAKLRLKNKEKFIQNVVENIAAWNSIPHAHNNYPKPPLTLDFFNQTIHTASAFDTPEDYMYFQMSFLQSILPFLHSSKVQKSYLPTLLPFITSLEQNANTSKNSTQYNTFLQNFKLHTTFIQNANFNSDLNKIKHTWRLQADYKDVPNTSEQLSINNFNFLKVAPTQLNYKKIVVPLSNNDKIDNILTFLDLAYDPQSNLAQENIQNISTEDANNNLQVFTSAFYVLQKEITQAQFALFLQDNPAWTKEVQNKLSVDTKQDYLKDFSPQETPKLPIRYISYYDVQKFVQWFNNILKNTPKTAKYTAKIPNEFEWRAAARTQGKYNNALLNAISSDEITESRVIENAFSTVYSQNTSRTDLIGSLWEWTDSWYSPLPQFASFKGPSYGSEKIILGASYISKGVFINTVLETETRNASADPSSVSPYLGFRIIVISL